MKENNDVKKMKKDYEARISQLVVKNGKMFDENLRLNKKVIELESDKLKAINIIGNIVFSMDKEK